MTIYIYIYIYIYYCRYSALGPVWAQTRSQSGNWYSSGTLHPGQVLRGRLPLFSPDIYIYIYIYIIIGIQPLGRFGQRPELSQATGIALVRCILGKFLEVGCHYFPPLF